MGNVKIWLKGLLVAAINGAIATAGTMAYNNVTTGQQDWRTIGSIAGSAAVLGAINYIIKSPRQTP